MVGPATAAGDDAPVRVVVVGAGNAGRQHVAAVQALRGREGPGAEVAAVVDQDPVAAAQLGPPTATLAAALGDPGVEVVAVCTPPGGRAELVRTALAAGKHVLVEKPPARSVAELDDLCAAATTAGRRLAVMFQHRFVLPAAVRRARERFAAATGTLVVSRQRPESHFRATGWRSDPATALGGITAHLGVHYLDLACQLLGEPVGARVVGRTDTPSGIDLELTGEVEFARGARLQLLVTSRSATRLEQLTLLAGGDWLVIRDGAAGGRVDGRDVAVPARPAGELRREVYRELVAAARGAPLRVSSFAEARDVTAALTALLGGEEER